MYQRKSSFLQQNKALICILIVAFYFVYCLPFHKSKINEIKKEVDGCKENFE